ncbi:hypothetical protein HY643_03470 [Candidatus Woesearchaeota archaeon]|nr:hypothetical protein [Candidatus Woesearchaeota archaeon]
MKISYIGANSLDSFEIAKLQDHLGSFSKKVGRHFEEGELIVTVKKYKKSGNTPKFSIHLRLQAPNVLVTSTNADWDLARTINKVCEELENCIKHKFKDDVTNRRKKSFKA